MQNQHHIKKEHDSLSCWRGSVKGLLLDLVDDRKTFRHGCLRALAWEAWHRRPLMGAAASIATAYLAWILRRAEPAGEYPNRLQPAGATIR
jgi:hypothetical protein